MCGMGWTCHSVGVLADHSLDILAALGVVNCDAVTAVKNSQAVVAELGAWFDNELHNFLLCGFCCRVKKSLQIEDLLDHNAIAGIEEMGNFPTD